MIPRSLLFLLLIVGLVFAADDSQSQDDCSNSEKDNLHIQQDKSLLYKPGLDQYLWSSIVTPNEEN